jgi:DNA-binding CsgD family transcriptional regulator
MFMSEAKLLDDPDGEAMLLTADPLLQSKLDFMGFSEDEALPFEVQPHFQLASEISDVMLVAQDRRAKLKRQGQRLSRRKRPLEPLPRGICFTRREVEVLYWVTEGKSDWQIGRLLHISQKTANFHAENAKRKLGVATRVQAALRVERAGLLEDIRQEYKLNPSVCDVKDEPAIALTAVAVPDDDGSNAPPSASPALLPPPPPDQP